MSGTVEKNLTRFRLRSIFALRSDQFEYLELIVLAALIGFLAALGNLGFRELINFFTWLFRGIEWHALGIRPYWPYDLLIPLILLSGGVGILILEWLYPGEVMGYGFPKFLEMVNLGKARIKGNWIIVKSLGASLSLGSGAQIGGAIGSVVAQAARLSVARSKVLVAAGAGAGIATTFNAPIGGLMFAQEIVLLNEIETANLSLLIVATMSAVVAERAIMGNEAVFNPAPFVLRSYWEMLTYCVMGVVFGLLSAAFIRFFHATADYFRKLQLPAWCKLAIGLVVVGLIAIPFPQNLSDGYPTINRAMAGDFQLNTMALLAAAKFLTSSVSLACGAPGGVFGPIFFIGTMAGGASQRALSHLVPTLTGPRGSYALVGLGAFLSGVTHAPLTALFLLFEMTQDYQIALPAMIASVAALAISRAIEPESIDTFALARAGKSLEIGKERLLLSQIPVGDVMTRDVQVAHENSSLADVLRLAGDTSQTILPVVDSENHLAGIIVTRHLLSILSGGNELSPLVNAFDLAWRNHPLVTPENSLDEATQLMEHEALEELPVVDSQDRQRLVGIVTRRAIAQTFHRVNVSLSTLATRDDNIFWASGYRVTRINVPPGAAGKTLREIDPRSRHSVSVLAVRSADDPEGGFSPIAADRPLKAGDMLVVAGRPSGLRNLARELEAM
jgi:CIC family chloride channel protein